MNSTTKVRCKINLAGGVFTDHLNIPVHVDVDVLQPRAFGVGMDYRL
jgi:hypothetical protein